MFGTSITIRPSDASFRCKAPPTSGTTALMKLKGATSPVEGAEKYSHLEPAFRRTETPINQRWRARLDLVACRR
jgi:hypothetical protein